MRKSILYAIIVIIISMVFLGCGTYSGDNPLGNTGGGNGYGILDPSNHHPVENGEPQISDVVAPDSIQKGIPDSSFASVKVQDPQGLSDIDAVYYVVTKPDGTSNGIKFPLTDDGQGYDSTAGDGIYSTAIAAPLSLSQTGNFIFAFTAMDKKGKTSNTIDKIINAYDSPIISLPYGEFLYPERTDLLVSSKVKDVQGQNTIDSVWVDLTYLDSSRFIGSYLLNDLGLNGDDVAADSVYSVDIISPDMVFSIGSYLIAFQAIDHDGHRASAITRTVVLE
jgi:hypothetical protein